MVWAFKNFINKPHNDMNDRISTLEIEVSEIKTSLLQGNDRFRNESRKIEVLIQCVFALLEFEVHYCETEQKPISENLEEAKNDLQKFLGKSNY
jgi:hypothetical protein